MKNLIKLGNMKYLSLVYLYIYIYIYPIRIINLKKEGIKEFISIETYGNNILKYAGQIIYQV